MKFIEAGPEAAMSQLVNHAGAQAIAIHDRGIRLFAFNGRDDAVCNFYGVGAPQLGQDAKVPSRRTFYVVSACTWKRAMGAGFGRNAPSPQRRWA